MYVFDPGLSKAKSHMTAHIQLLEVRRHRGRKPIASADCFLPVPQLILRVCVCTCVPSFVRTLVHFSPVIRARVESGHYLNGFRVQGRIGFRLNVCGSGNTGF